MSATQRLLGKTRLRLGALDFGRKFRLTFLVIAGVSLTGLLLARLLALVPNHWFTPVTLIAAAGASFLLALGLLRRPNAATVARTLDARAQTKELFLTATLIENAPGAYQEIVLDQAEARAQQLNARKLVPFSWAKGARDLAIAAAVVVAAYFWLPQLDPFRMDARRQDTVKKEQRLEELKKITAARKDELLEKSPAITEQVQIALNQLDKTLKEVKPEERTQNAKKLNEEAQDFSELWKKLSEQLPKNASDQLEKAAQAFGDSKQREALKDAIAKLKEGDAKPLQDALQRMREQLEEIAKKGEGPEQKKELEKLARDAAKLAEQLRQQLGEKGLNEALQRALEQMDLAQLKELAKDGIEGANASMELSQQELERMAEMFKDMKNVQDALKNLQAAKQLNEQGQLDGKDAEGAGAKSPADYEALYQKLLAQGGGEGNQPGRGGGNKPGLGQGGSVGENKDAVTQMKDEKEKSKLGAGKMLMQWKDEGVGEVGQRGAEYREAMRAIKEGAAEAIRNEQVPPGYHPVIQKYFDRLPAELPKK